MYISKRNNFYLKLILITLINKVLYRNICLNLLYLFVIKTLCVALLTPNLDSSIMLAEHNSFEKVFPNRLDIETATGLYTQTIHQ